MTPKVWETVDCVVGGLYLPSICEPRVHAKLAPLVGGAGYDRLESVAWIAPAVA